jgi:hypothetical protein
VLGLCVSALFVAGCEQPNHWAVGCTEGVCAAVNNDGEIRYFDLSTKKATGTGTLPTKPVGTVNIDCNSSETGRAAPWSTAPAMSGLGRRPGDPSSKAASKWAAAKLFHE